MPFTLFMSLASPCVNMIIWSTNIARRSIERQSKFTNTWWKTKPTSLLRKFYFSISAELKRRVSTFPFIICRWNDLFRQYSNRVLNPPVDLTDDYSTDASTDDSTVELTAEETFAAAAYEWLTLMAICQEKNKLAIGLACKNLNVKLSSWHSRFVLAADIEISLYKVYSIIGHLAKKNEELISFFGLKREAPEFTLLLESIGITKS